MKLISALLVSVFTGVSGNSATVDTNEKLSVEGGIRGLEVLFCPLDDARSQKCQQFDRGCGKCLDDITCEYSDTSCRQAAVRACKEFCNVKVLTDLCGDFCKDCASKGQLDALYDDTLDKCPLNLGPTSPKFYNCFFDFHDIETLEKIARSACARVETV